MKYKMIISDFDGTMAIKGQVSEETVKAILEYQAKGGKFVICTGRSPSSILRVANKFDLPSLAGAHQGSCLLDVRTGEVISNGGIDYRVAYKILKEILKDFVAVAYLGDELLYDTPCKYQGLFTGICKCTKVDDLAKEVLARKQVVNRIVISTEPELVKGIIEKYTNNLGEYACFNSGTDFIVEIVDKTYNKRRAVEILSDYFNIPYEEIMVIGDSTNDIPLFDGEWYRVAVGNADEKLKKLADEITVNREEHPIKVLIEKYCLEK